MPNKIVANCELSVCTSLELFLPQLMQLAWREMTRPIVESSHRMLGWFVVYLSLPPITSNRPLSVAMVKCFIGGCGSSYYSYLYLVCTLAQSHPAVDFCSSNAFPVLESTILIAFVVSFDVVC